MKTLYKKLGSLVREEEGTETVEWAIVAALLILVAAAVWTTIGTNVKATLTELGTQTKYTP